MEKHTITLRGIKIEIIFTPEKFDMIGDAVAYFTAWLDFEAERTRWRDAQLSLF